VVTGGGDSYGMEVFLNKSTGKTTGWIGYTLSWSNRQFDEISFGREFPYKYDRRHDVAVVVMHQLSDQVDLGLTWVYGTGLAITLPDEKFLSPLAPLLSGNPLLESGLTPGANETRMIQYFTHRNGYRAPAYHRMDVGVNFRKEKKWGERTWSFGAYNSYNRQNPFFLYIGDEYNNKTHRWDKQLYQVSLLPIVPYLRYSFKF
jgi:hypothetical protein